jgi:hypothetical protein
MLVALADGTLYAAIETEDANLGTYPITVRMLKSTDGGQSWACMDQDSGFHGDGYKDIEGLDIHLVEADDTIFVGIQRGSTPHYAEFNTKGHSTNADQWAHLNWGGNTWVEDVDSGATPGAAQRIGLIYRTSDNVAWMAYSDTDASNDRVSLKKRTSSGPGTTGTWDASPTDLDGTAGVDIAGGYMALDASNVIHIIYLEWDDADGTSTSGNLYHKTINTSDVLTSDGSRVKVNGSITLEGTQNTESQPFCPPIIYDDGGTERIGLLFRASGGELYFTQSPTSSISFSTPEKVTDGTTLVAHSGETGASGGDSVIADLAWDPVNDEQHAVWADPNGTPTTFSDDIVRADQRSSGSWGTDTSEYSSAYVASLRSTYYSYGGSGYIGYMWDNADVPGSLGGLRFSRIGPLAAAGPPLPPLYSHRPMIPIPFGG